LPADSSRVACAARGGGLAGGAGVTGPEKTAAGSGTAFPRGEGARGA